MKNHENNIKVPANLSLNKFRTLDYLVCVEIGAEVRTFLPGVYVLTMPDEQGEMRPVSYQMNSTENAAWRDLPKVSTNTDLLLSVIQNEIDEIKLSRCKNGTWLAQVNGEEYFSIRKDEEEIPASAIALAFLISRGYADFINQRGEYNEEFKAS